MLIYSSILAVLDYLHGVGFNIKIKNRSSVESYCWDGNSIATHCDIRYFTEHEILHEIGHWIACSDPGQKLFPEFGLMIGLGPDATAYGPKGGDFIDLYGRPRNYLYARETIINGLIDKEEQTIQEFVAQKISIYLGKKFSVCPKLPDLDWMSWDDYDAYKDLVTIFTSDHYYEVKNRFSKVAQKFA